MHFLIAATWDGSPIDAAEHVSVAVSDGGDDLLVHVSAPFFGDPAPPGTGSTEGLWEYEVVELFVVGSDGTYVEIELGPRGHYLVLRLRGVRDVAERGLPLVFEAWRHGGRWTAEARVPRAWLPPGPHRANAFAIHGVGEARRYLCATPLPGARPDFHQPDRFAEVELP